MTTAVIIGHNEGMFILDMINGLNKIGITNRIWVLDRCDDGSDEILRDMCETFVRTPYNLEGRHTSFARNLGLSFVPFDDVLFLDGDRYIVDDYGCDIGNNGFDIELLTLEVDYRNTSDFDINKYMDKWYGTVHNHFFSCGLWMSREAIDKVCEYNRNELGCCEGELFLTRMQKEWGIEDTSLGDICYLNGLTVRINTDIRLRGCFDRFVMSDEAMLTRLRFMDSLGLI